jgi:polyhydroxybutyrate depolymerase
MKILVTAALLLASVIGASGQAWAQAASTGKEMRWTVQGTDRRALVFVPKDVSGPLSVVLAFHGAGDTADNFSGVGFQQAWPQALVVYMRGLGRVPGGGGAFQTTDASDRNRDLAFVDTVLASLRQTFTLDERRIYATGFSNGAKFVYLLWATRAKTFAAFAPVAGMLTANVSLTDPKPFVHIGGREDHQNAFAEQLRSVEMGRAVDGATASGTSCGADCTLYASTRGAAVMTLLHPGGHVYPREATALIVNFFRTHP